MDSVTPAGVRARGWGWRHAGRAAPAVRNLDLDIAPGEKVLLLGPSGAGKSTLLHALAGVLGADEEAAEAGSLYVDGVPAHHARGRAGLMQQDPETQVVLSRVGDDVAFGAENLAVPPNEIRRRIPAALAAVGLDLPLEHPTAQLSGGQKQRLALAGILAMRPGLILLDEPTANLDPDGVTEVRDAVLAAADSTGATLLVVEHRVDVWAGGMDRIVVLEPGGGVLFDGPPDTVLAAGRRELLHAGVWVPGYLPDVGRKPGNADSGGGQLLLSADDLGVSREQQSAGWRSWRPRSIVPVLTDASVDIRSGQALSITGANGSGKSTLALTLGGLLRPVRGAVTAAAALRDETAATAQTAPAGSRRRRNSGNNIGAEPYGWKAADLVARIGSVFQEPEHQFVTGSVREELAFGPRHSRGRTGPGTGPWTEQRIAARTDELLERLRLTALADANPFTLSGGEKRRLSVGTVLASGPQVLILDEPTFGQDANTWSELAQLLIELLDAGTAVVSVTHDRHFTAALGARELAL